MPIRRAQLEDVPFVADCIVRAAREVQAVVIDPYALRIPRHADAPLLEFVESFIERHDRLGLVARVADVACGCLLCSLRDSEAPGAKPGDLGRIEFCWVDDGQRRHGLALQLTAAAEAWFRMNGATLSELAYPACDAVAASAIDQLGYRQFRILAYKQLVE